MDHYCPCRHEVGENEDHWCPCPHTLQVGFIAEDLLDKIYGDAQKRVTGLPKLGDYHTSLGKGTGEPMLDY